MEAPFLKLKTATCGTMLILIHVQMLLYFLEISPNSLRLLARISSSLKFQGENIGWKIV